MNKYRDGKIKREHTVIERVWPVLEQMATCETITSIIPGPISRLNTKGFEVTFQRFTETGLRLLAKNGSAVQEVYVVTTAKEATLQWLADQAIVDWHPPRAPKLAPALVAGPGPFKTITLPSNLPCTVCGKLMVAGSRAVQLGKRNYQYLHVRCAK
jgi:hypothetical protein